ncbi:hypothetical protein PL79_009090 [Burkholderia sp. USMB20]|nr:hypothetical protein PL79_009090 [Burkholderia sp. USMB20]
MYLADLFDRYFSNCIEAGQPADLIYDYNTLLRGLLKISYNSVRSTANEKQRKLLSRFAKQILQGGAFPSVMVRLQIVTTSRATTVIGHEVGALRPEVLRSATVSYDGRFSNRFCIRLIAFRSYWFYVIIPYKNEPQHIWREFIKCLGGWVTPMGVPLEPNKNVASIPVNKTTWVSPTLLGRLARDLEEIEL